MATSFGPPQFVLSAFGPAAGGWSSQNLYPRLLADINNDGNADIVGFAGNGVDVSLANGMGGFQAPMFADGTSFWGAQTGGWSSQDANPRELAGAACRRAAVAGETRRRFVGWLTMNSRDKSNGIR